MTEDFIQTKQYTEMLIIYYLFSYRNKMASKTILFLLGLTIIAVAYATAEVEEEEGLSFEDFEEYFNTLQMEKRGGKKIGRKFLDKRY